MYIHIHTDTGEVVGQELELDGYIFDCVHTRFVVLVSESRDVKVEDNFFNYFS